jgi:hypothetical protein
MSRRAVLNEQKLIKVARRATIWPSKIREQIESMIKL